MSNLLAAVDNIYFWMSPRKVQVVVMLRRKRNMTITDRDISTVMDVSVGVVSRYKHYMIVRPDAPFRRPGRPSPLDDVFPHEKNFIRDETTHHRSVTIGVLMEYLADTHNVFVSRRNLWEYMTNHGYAYVWGVPTEDHRAVPNIPGLTQFYTRDLPEAVNGVHPSLVYNSDEMGTERFADKKEHQVFVLESEAPADGTVAIGIERTARRCTLLACIALDGTCLKPAIITKNRTVNSRLFEKGLTPKDIAMYWTENSFMDGDTFYKWL